MWLTHFRGNSELSSLLKNNDIYGLYQALVVLPCESFQPSLILAGNTWNLPTEGRILKLKGAPLGSVLSPLATIIINGKDLLPEKIQVYYRIICKR